jgi:hypothetical protein
MGPATAGYAPMSQAQVPVPPYKEGAKPCRFVCAIFTILLVLFVALVATFFVLRQICSDPNNTATITSTVIAGLDYTVTADFVMPTSTEVDDSILPGFYTVTLTASCSGDDVFGMFATDLTHPNPLAARQRMTVPAGVEDTDANRLHLVKELFGRHLFNCPQVRLTVAAHDQDAVDAALEHVTVQALYTFPEEALYVVGN